MRRWTRGTMVAAGCAAALACAEPGPTETDPCRVDDGRLRVLFIGNSLTYTYGVPSLVAALADSLGEPRPAVEAVTAPDAGLPDHWNGTAARAAIRRACWDVVVLQQGPSALPASRAVLVDYAARFAAETRAAGAEPALYSVWPARARAGDLDASIESYRAAAEAVDGILLPAGAAWRAAWARDPDAPLYAADGLHPSAEGAYLAALAITGRLYGRRAAEMPDGVRYSYAEGSTTVSATVRVPPERAALLRAAADEALAAP